MSWQGSGPVRQYLVITIYDAVRRPLRRGWWSRWTVERVNENEASTIAISFELHRGWTRAVEGSEFIEFKVDGQGLTFG